MLKTTAAVSALAFSAALVAAPTVSEYRHDDQVVRLMSGVASAAPMLSLINEKVDGKTVRRNLPQKFLGGPIQSFWARVRMVDGKQICEKFAIVPGRWSEQEVAARADELFREPC